MRGAPGGPTVALMKSRIAATFATAVRHLGASHIPGTLVGIALAMALTSCGSAGTETAPPAEESSSRASASPSQSPSGDKDEQITPGGIAVVVLEHLGRDAVQQFGIYESDPGDVSVMIKLRDSSRYGHFAVSVYSAKHDEFGGKAGKCPPKHRSTGTSQCRTLDNGTTVMTSEVPYGFSDDNANGMVVYGTAITPKNGTAIAMYESYDKSPSVSAADLESLLTDPRLTWLTDPALNEAGEDVDLKRLTG